MVPLRVLDAFCKAGGATKGYMNAGFHVTGIDIERQPNYCGDNFILGDAIEYIYNHGHLYDLIHASPPCQDYSKTKRLTNNSYRRLISNTRDAIDTIGIPYIIENVVGSRSELIDPFMLCGAMFGLTTYRHRLFEIGGDIEIRSPADPIHIYPNAKMGRTAYNNEFIHVIGNFPQMQLAQKAMKINWMTRQEMAQAIPPAYTEFIGRQLYDQISKENN